MVPGSELGYHACGSREFSGEAEVGPRPVLGSELAQQGQDAAHRRQRCHPQSLRQINAELADVA